MKLFSGVVAIVLVGLFGCGGASGGGATPAPIGNQASDPAPAAAPDPVPPPSGGGGDGDGDGRGDADDLCPSDPEDLDGFEDEDGCPDPDNDRDGIRDLDDKCPNEPESFDGQTDDDGCPP
jgi:hypothetical protein